MSGPIQTIPQGLLGLLQLKQTGQNPPQLADVVSPVLSLFDFYANRQALSEVGLLALTTGANSLTVNARGQVSFSLVVPTFQTWYIQNMTCSALLLAAEYIRAAPMILPTGSGPGSQLQVGIDVNDVVTARARAWTATAGGFWMPPGSQFGLSVMDIITAGNITVSLGLRGVAVPI